MSDQLIPPKDQEPVAAVETSTVTMISADAPAGSVAMSGVTVAEICGSLNIGVASTVTSESLVLVTVIDISHDR